MVRSFLVCLALVACGPSDHAQASPPPSTPSTPKAEPEQVDQKVVVEKMPDGSIKKTTITTTRKVVEAPPPPARPADPYPSDPLVKYNVDRINAYRAQKNLGPVLYDAKISSFATKGSERLSRDHTPHANFAENIKSQPPGFGSRSAENQGDPSGVPALDADPIASGKKQIDVMMKLMMDEGPGGGHYENMMNPRFRRVGIGLVYAGGKLYLTNDFSD
jgi:uncharacterized protein YkwD